jgi:hypothetical protein
MGASGWAYFVPFQVDIAKALQQLRDEVFQRGDYFRCVIVGKELTLYCMRVQCPRRFYLLDFLAIRQLLGPVETIIYCIGSVGLPPWDLEWNFGIDPVIHKF